MAVLLDLDGGAVEGPGHHDEGPVAAFRSAVAEVSVEGE